MVLDLGNVMFIVGLIAAVWALVDKVLGAKAKANAPTEKRLTELEAQVNSIKERQASDWDTLKKFPDFKDANREFQNVTLRILKNMLDHFLTGNETGNMQKLSKEIEDYLFRG